MSLRACIWHTESGRPAAQKLLVGLNQNSSDLMTNLWSFTPRSPGLTELQHIQSELDEYDFFIVVLSEGDFQQTSILHGELIKLGMGMGRIGVERVFILLPSQCRAELPSIFDGHEVLEFQSDRARFDNSMGTQMVQISLKIGEIGGRVRYRKLDKQIDDGVKDLLKCALSYDLSEYQSILESVARNFIPPTGTTIKIAYLFRRCESGFVKMGASRYEQNREPMTLDEQSFVFEAYSANEAKLFTCDQLEWDTGKYDHIFVWPIERQGCALTVHLLSDVILSNSAEIGAELSVNNRLVATLDYIIGRRNQYERSSRQTIAGHSV
ncbi:hypothetical protein [Tumebacillus flagellatus]|uniref:CD-NTase-associated protein 12/Pycsar effector protein TIR domain-containing protein n=1 Tax=Tumebacillus flagellatus TaxID=1157490 RepID=A0A074LPW5_9BACL|nr:hypothetical protein [Tumebacillus flagellatus]KEO83109.1 hypothetical protein EL26_11615 [Tumebacillus flagellatus]